MRNTIKIKLMTWFLFFPFMAMAQNDSIHFAGEKHFKNVRQLTFGGNNTEAYFSYDGKYLVFQKTDIKAGIACDQIFMGKIPASGEEFKPKLISTGKGRTTSPFFSPDNRYLIYSTTHHLNKNCPPVPDAAKYGNKNVKALYPEYDMFVVDTSGKLVRQLTNTRGYDAEATISPLGDRVIFTSMRDGDPELYTMKLNGKDIQRITYSMGYDGGAWFSHDGKKIIWRASRPYSQIEINEYTELLKENLVSLVKMELWMANADGSGAKKITNLGQSNGSPNFTPDDKKIIFCSNHEHKKGFPFNMYLIDPNVPGKEKISRGRELDTCPMFSLDGKKIVFCSNRNSGADGGANIFTADWVD